MVYSDESIPSLLQIMWDHVLKEKNIMIILSGSSVSFMEDEVLGYKNPLYGRATGIYRLEELPYHEAFDFFPKYSMEEKVVLYAITSSIPQYLQEFDDKKALKGNICLKILKRGSILNNETENVLKEELRQPLLI